MATNDITTTNEELIQMVRDGYFFNFCVGYALNQGYKDAMLEREEVKFNVGDYNVKFDDSSMCFILSHNEFFARIITAYPTQVVFIGDNEDEVISELLAEVEKELS